LGSDPNEGWRTIRTPVHPMLPRTFDVVAEATRSEANQTGLDVVPLPGAYERSTVSSDKKC
jgi:hypothetical protein